MANRTMTLRAKVSGATQVKDLGRAATDTGTRFDATNAKLDKSSRATGILARATALLSSAIGGLGTISSASLAAITAIFTVVTAASAGVISTGESFQQLQIDLEGVAGAAVPATFEQIQTFALQTPDSIDQVTAAFVTLGKAGIEPAERLLKSFGDVAAENRSGIDRFSSAVVSAAEGQFSALEEFGIKTEEVGDRVRFTVKGVTTDVERDAAQIISGLVRIGETQFSGGLERQAESLSGSFDRLRKAGSGLANTIFEFGTGQIATAVIDFVTKLVRGLDLLVQGLGTTEEFFHTLNAAGHETFAAIHSVGNRAFVGLGRIIVDFANTAIRAWRPIFELLDKVARRFGSVADSSESFDFAQRAVDRLARRLNDSEAGAQKAIAGYKATARAAFELAIEARQAARESADFAKSGLQVETAASAAQKTIAELTARIKALRAEIATELARPPVGPAAAESALASLGAGTSFLDTVFNFANIGDLATRVVGEIKDTAGDLDLGEIIIPTESQLRKMGEGLRQSLRDASKDFFQDLKDSAGSFGIELGRAIAEGNVRETLASMIRDVAAQAGAQIGGAVAGPLGAFAGGILGSLVGDLLAGLFSSGADEAFAELSALNGALQVTAATIEGELRPALDDMARSVIGSVNLILAEFGGTLEAGIFGFKIREGEVVRIFYAGLQAEFENQAEAASFLVAKILAEGVVSGLTASVQEALEGGNFTSAEQLVEALEFGQGIDRALMDPLEIFFDQTQAQTRLLLATSVEYGISIDRVVQARAREIQAELDLHAAVVLAATGANASLNAWSRLQESISVLTPASIEKLQDNLQAAAEQAEEMAKAAEQAERVFGGTRSAFDEWINSAGLSDEAVQRLTERYEEMQAAGLDAAEIADAISIEIRELGVELEGLPIETLREAVRVFRGQFIVGLFGDLAGVLERTGRHREAAQLRARAEELEIRMKLISIRTTTQAALAEGILNEARVRQINEFIRAAQRGLNELIRAGAFSGAGSAGGDTGGLGGGGNRVTEAVRTQEDALESWNRLMQETSDRINGITQEERRRIDTEAQLQSDLDAGLISLEQFNQAMANLATVAELGADQISAAARRAMRRLERLNERQGFLSIGRELAQLAGDQEAVLMFEKELARLRIDQLLLEAQLLFEAGKISERRWRNFEDFGRRAFAAIEDGFLDLATFNIPSILSGLTRGFNELGLSMSPETTHALAVAQMQLVRAELLATLATDGLAEALMDLGVDIQPLIEMINDWTPPLIGPPPPAAPGSGGNIFAAGHVPGQSQSENPLDNLLSQLTEWERRLEIDLMNPLDQAIARAADRGEQFIQALRDAGASIEDITRAQEALQEEIERIQADHLDRALKPLRDLIADLTGGPGSGLSGVDQVDVAQQRFLELAERARAGDQEAISQLGRSGSDLIGLAETVSPSLARRIRELVLATAQEVEAIAVGGAAVASDDDKPPQLRTVELKPTDIVREPVTLRVEDLLTIARGQTGSTDNAAEMIRTTQNRLIQTIQSGASEERRRNARDSERKSESAREMLRVMQENRDELRLLRSERERYERRRRSDAEDSMDLQKLAIVEARRSGAPGRETSANRKTVR